MARTITQPGPDRTNRLIFIGAVLLAGIAAILVFVALSNFGGSSNSNASIAAPVNVVVAAHSIAAGSKVADGDLSIATLPAKGTIEGAITDKSQVVGLTVRVPLSKGEQFSAVKLGQTDIAKVPSNAIPDGKRAVGVKVDEQAIVSGLIVAGDHVDVVVIGKKKVNDASVNSPSNEIAASFTLLQNIEVFSVSDNPVKATASTDASGTPVSGDTAVGNTAVRPSNTDASPNARTVALLVDPGEAASLALASSQYTVYLVLRGNGDKGTISNPADLITLPAQQ